MCLQQGQNLLRKGHQSRIAAAGGFLLEQLDRRGMIL